MMEVDQQIRDAFSTANDFLKPVLDRGMLNLIELLIHT